MCVYEANLYVASNVREQLSPSPIREQKLPDIAGNMVVFLLI